MTAFAGFCLDHGYAALPRSAWTAEDPTPVAAPRLLLLDEELAAALGLDPDALKSPQGVAILAGNALPPGGRPIAQAYAGHQFGHFTRLGDGRAILLGEQRTPDGRSFDIQLKGAGRTAWSRSGDGRAALGPMLREWLFSIAMAGLGIPTTHSLAVLSTGEVVMRERPQPGAILVRVASSHLRVGSFQYAAALKDRALLEALLAFALDRHYPDRRAEGAAGLLEAVARAQSRLVAQWMLAGFVHGVMNTDNMAISGETIDYGPCAFIDRFRRDAVFSSIDHHGRYAWQEQPRILRWNLARLAEALLPLLGDSPEDAVERANAVLDRVEGWFEAAWTAGFNAKLGLETVQPADRALGEALLDAMEADGADFAATWRALDPERAPTSAGLARWHPRWTARLATEGRDPDAVRSDLAAANPAVIARNHQVAAAIEAAEAGDLGPVRRLAAALRRPFTVDPADLDLTLPPPADAPPTITYCGT